MEKNELIKDYLVSRIISFGKKVEGYGNIYYKANENLLDAYLDVDFNGKDVLSVMASGDQVLTAKFLDSKRVDAFDCNRLALYYYYLRIWSIQYMDTLYPEILNGNFKWMNILLQKVKPQSEQEKQAYWFFKRHVEDKTNWKKLFYDVDIQPKGKTIYTSAEELKDYVKEDITFHTLDLFQECYLEMTYDIVLISNILEWARGDIHKLETACQNLSRLLNTNGVVIGSRLVNNNFEKEQTIMQKSFEMEQKRAAIIYRKK